MAKHYFCNEDGDSFASRDMEAKEIIGFSLEHGTLKRHKISGIPSGWWPAHNIKSDEDVLAALKKIK